jgi:hypothetical protein
VRRGCGKREVRRQEEKMESGDLRAEGGGRRAEVAKKVRSEEMVIGCQTSGREEAWGMEQRAWGEKREIRSRKSEVS